MIVLMVVVIMIVVEMMKLLLITCVRTLSSHCRGPFKWSSEVEHCKTKWQCNVAIGNVVIWQAGDKRWKRGHLSSRESRWPSVYGTRRPTPGCTSAWGGATRWLPSRFGRRRRWWWWWWWWCWSDLDKRHADGAHPRETVDRLKSLQYLNFTNFDAT